MFVHHYGKTINWTKTELLKSCFFAAYSFVHYKADTKLSFETAKLKDTESFHYTISNIEAIFFFQNRLHVSTPMLHATITPIIVKMQTLEVQWETIAL